MCKISLFQPHPCRMSVGCYLSNRILFFDNPVANVDMSKVLDDKVGNGATTVLFFLYGYINFALWLFDKVN